MIYKIQLGFENGFYVAYLVKHDEFETDALIIGELTNTDLDDLIESIPYEWKERLTNFLNN